MGWATCPYWEGSDYISGGACIPPTHLPVGRYFVFYAKPCFFDRLKYMDKVRIALIGAGSGGHYFPLLAVARSLQSALATAQAPSDIRYFGDAGSYDHFFAEQGIVVVPIASSKLRRYASMLNLLDFFKFFWGFLQALFKLYWFMPDVLFSKSGPGTLPIIFAARWYRIPVIIHESDSIPGVSNTIASRHAAIVEVAFEHAKRFFPDHKDVRIAGLPIREGVINKKSPAECRRALGLSDERPIIFIVGGSQGAEKLNDFVIGSIHALLTQFEIIHQIGTANYDAYMKEYAFVTKFFPPGLLSRYRPLAFLSEEQIADAFGACDMVISRAGSSIFEIAANGKPAILVPLASSANNHQFENAYAYSQAGAGVVIEEQNLLPGLVISQLQKMSDDVRYTTGLSEHALAFYKPEAATTIAKDVLAVAGIRSV